MRTFRLIAVSVVFAAIFAVSALAQAPTASKIGLINTSAFDDTKAGITKYINAVNTLNTEFKPLATELDNMATKINALQKEIEILRKQAQEGKVPVNQATANAKLEEYDKLTREYKFKQDDAKVKYNRRQEAVLGPIRQDIGNAIQEFAKKNGYTIILDVAKLAQAALILGVDERADVTKQFIAFYNTRPTTTATVTK
jgi:outer membrane protein